MGFSYEIDEVVRVGEGEKYTSELRELISKKMLMLFSDDASRCSVKLNNEEKTADWKQVLKDIEHLDSFELYLSYDHYVNSSNFGDSDVIYSILDYFENAPEAFLIKNQYVLRDSTNKSNDRFSKVYSYNYNGSGNHGLVKFVPVLPENVHGTWDAVDDLFEVYKEDIGSTELFNKIAERVLPLFECSYGEYVPEDWIVLRGDSFKDEASFFRAVNAVCEINKEFMNDFFNSYEVIFDSDTDFGQLKVKFNVEEGTAEYEYAAV